MKVEKRVGVVMGGCSSEREISLRSGRGIYDALLRAGCDAVEVDLKTNDEAQIIRQLKDAGVEIVFLALHGKFGEDGGIQKVLERSGILYTGSGVAASRLAMDKTATQELLKTHNILVPDFFVIAGSALDHSTDLCEKIGGFPVVVKPACEGSSIGITLARDEAQLLSALREAFRYGDRVLVEKYIQGREITSGILGDEALPLIEIRSGHEFFDFSAKYQKGQSEHLVPAPLPESTTRMIQEISRAVFHLIGCRDMARSDFMLDEKGQVFFLEINTIPGFTEVSLLPKAARKAGLSFDELCLRIVEFANARGLLSGR